MGPAVTVVNHARSFGRPPIMDACSGASRTKPVRAEGRTILRSAPEIRHARHSDTPTLRPGPSAAQLPRASPQASPLC
ncbi:hypothetical protein AL035_22010 [Salipiger aestuarii]|nr:hypothetical protein AL035_22010 [Salipiger aestuarii]